MTNKQILAAILALLLTATLFVTTATAQLEAAVPGTDAAVVIPDAALAAAIREALSLPAEHSLTAQDMFALRTLDATNRGITALTGLEAATNLITLNLAGNTGVSDVLPLASLTQLEELWLDNTGVSDVLPLAGLTQLEELWLANTSVSDVSPLASLTQLEVLYLHGTGVSDVSPLASLTQLEVLYLWGTGVLDVSPLAGLTQLEELSLDNTGVLDVSPLASLTQLEELWLGGIGVLDVSPLASLTQLEKLYLHGTGVLDVSPLASLTQLEELSLDNTGVLDVSPLASLTQLTRLWLNGTGVSDVSPLASLTQLTGLYLWDTSVLDVSPLARLIRLEELSLGDTGVLDVSPLAGLTQLTGLWLNGCPLSDASLHTHIPALQAKGIYVAFDAPTELSPVVHVGTDALPPMYWINTTYRKLYRLTGDAVKYLNPYVQNATSIVVDVAGNKLYWTEQTGERSGRILRSNFNSFTSELVRDLTSVPRDLAIDSAGGTLYLTNSWGKIQRLNVDGSGFQPNLITGLESPQHLALDVAGGKVYWTAPGSIWRATLTGKNREKLIADLGAIGSIAVAGSKIYWTEENKNDTKSGKVRRAALDGSNVQTLATLLSVPSGIAVDAVGRKLYWTNSKGRIQRANLAGNNIQNLVTGLGMPAELALGRTGGRAAPTVPAILPEKTVLLPNYPNPFNPETWLPYLLSKPDEVTVTIYAANGAVVRTLALGHQHAGSYASRSRAAYWDGRNALGERVASGVYFYTLTAGEFHATRKMLILK